MLLATIMFSDMQTCLFLMQHAAMEQFVWLEDYHLMREDWNTVTMEHGLSFVIIIFITKRL